MRLTFFGFERAKVALGQAQRVGGRLEAELALSGSTAAGPVAAPPVKLQLLGTADVAGVAPSSIGTVMPPPGAQEADTTKCVYVELTPADLPWRYTPRPRENGRVRPWLVLVVGSPAEVVAEPDGTVSLAGSVTAAYDLARSSRWAHVQQEEDGRAVGRVVSDRPLQPNADHVAALVAAFRPDGDDAWTAGQAGRVACYTLWRFRTGTAEDFYDLAKAIEAALPDPTLGSASVTYDPTGSTITTRGALAGIGTADAALPSDVTSDLDTRRRLSGADARGRTLVGLPRYGSAWGPSAQAETPGGWRAAVNGDARHRAVAGLGAWCALLEQERIAAAMRSRLGAIAVAGQRVAGLALGMAAAGSLWRRHLPSQAGARVLLFGPALERLVDGDDRTALELVTAEDRPWPAALFSTAARRLLRRGTAWGRLAGSAMAPNAVLGAANICREPRPPEKIRGLPHTVALAKFRRDEGENPEADPIEFSLHGDPTGPIPDGVERSSLVTLGPGILVGEREKQCRKVPVSVFVDRLDAAFDPGGAQALAPARVLGTIEGLGDPPLAPPEACPDIGLPAWAILRDRAKEWLLPGAETLGQNELTAVETNGVFVDAFLLGLNLQALEEARWRNFGVTTGCTPMRRFWELLRDDGSAVDDIRGVASWTEASALGDVAHRPSEAPPTRLVIVVRTALFRRYPNTLIYLYPAAAGFPRPTIVPTGRILPVFQGEIDRELPFFAFPVSPAQGRSHWLVIEQVPRGYEFWERNPDDDTQPLVPAGVLDGGEFAAKAFAQPIRVLINGSEIIPGVA